jgi:hypothetical protein
MIEVLKQALDAFEAIPEEIEGWIPDKCTDAVIAIKQAIAELESQEPVAHRDGYWCADLTCKKCYSADFRLKHTTHPPQRTWVGLTDEEISESSKGHMTRNGFARTIEAKLKEKNT